MARLSETGGEDALIELIRTRYGSPGGHGPVALGIGDDAALLDAGEFFDIVTTDLLIEGTHFRLDLTEPYLLGWKSAAVNLSDVAAMGGKPTCCFVSIGLPDVDISFAEELYRGISDVSHKYGSVIAGGDTVSSPAGVVINITQLGTVKKGFVAKRSGARPGQAIIVTNSLGDSRAGLELLLDRGLAEARRLSPYLVERHLKPEPRIREAAAAVRTGRVDAMMDISDGLSADLLRLCRSSGVGAVVRADSLPMSDEFLSAAQLLGADAIRLAAAGGEDYELLIVCDAAVVEGISEAVSECGSTATVIGETTETHGVRLRYPDGTEGAMPDSWQHFHTGPDRGG